MAESPPVVPVDLAVVRSVPVRERGTRTRAGNAMPRTRAALLAGAARVVAARGVRNASMAEIAAEAGVSKAALYNHFRTKSAVWTALAEAEVWALADDCRGMAFADALVHTARRLATHPVVQRLAADDPASLAALLLAPRATTPGWVAARSAVDRLLADGGRDRGAGDVVLRWLASHLTSPPVDDLSITVIDVMVARVTDVGRPANMGAAPSVTAREREEDRNG